MGINPIINPITKYLKDFLPCFFKASKILKHTSLNSKNKLELSVFVLTDGVSYKILPSAKDYKRIGENDTGLNTGGMGAYSPSNILNPDLENKILEKIIKPTFKAMNDIGESYTGFLYAGLMIKNNNPYLIEYNVRMGDPECQTILPLLKTDLLNLLNACSEKKLDKEEILWVEKKSICIVLCSKGYPESYEKNI